MTTQTTTDRNEIRGRPARGGPAPAGLWLRGGLVLTVLATVVPLFDRASSHRLAAHVRAGYPQYSSAKITAAVTTYLVILTLVGVLGTVGWLATLHSARAKKWWTPILATTLFVVGLVLAVTGLLTDDTSGQPGLPTWLGLVGTAPCLPGLIAVVLLWRRP